MRSSSVVLFYLLNVWSIVFFQWMGVFPCWHHSVFSSSCTNLSGADLLTAKTCSMTGPEKILMNEQVASQTTGDNNASGQSPVQNRNPAIYETLRFDSTSGQWKPTMKTITRPLSGPGNQYQPGLGKQVGQLLPVDFTG